VSGSTGRLAACRQQLLPKERILITVAALTAGGNADQLTFHLLPDAASRRPS
jgi:hypothetical protein